MTKKKPTFECKYCKKSYVRESTLMSHRCETKRRWDAQEDRSSRVGFMAWQQFTNTMVMAKRVKDRPFDEFIRSKLYTQFIKYAIHITRLNAVSPSRYTSYLLKHNFPVREWTKDAPYNSYMCDLLAKETPNEAIERSIKLAEEWAIDNDASLYDFFKEIHPNQALYWISNGKISPWFIYASSTVSVLMEKMTPDQLSELSKHLDHGVMVMRIRKYKKEFENIKAVLNEMGL